MSPELTGAVADKDIAIALKRLYNYKKLQELGAPHIIIEEASKLLDKSRADLGVRFDRISAKLFVEFKEMEDQAALAEQTWEERCQSCSSWNGGTNNQSEDMWCLRHSYESKPFPDECPDYQPGKADGDN
jgi:hypothetical protein